LINFEILKLSDTAKPLRQVLKTEFLIQKTILQKAVSLVNDYFQDNSNNTINFDH